MAILRGPHVCLRPAHADDIPTLEDIRRHNIIIHSPNIRLAEELGLPSGDWSGVPTQGNGSVPLGVAETDLLTGASLR